MTIELKTNGDDVFLEERGRLTFFAKIANLGRDTYGLELEGYEDGRLAFLVTQKSWATSLWLQTTLYLTKIVEGKVEVLEEEICNDPRVLMLHIISGKLMVMARRGEYNEQNAEKEINSVLPSPTIKEAQEWLEKNGFGGRNKRKSRDSDNAPGWSIAYDDYDLIGLSQDAKKLYLKYKKLWKRAEGKGND